MALAEYQHGQGGPEAPAPSPQDAWEKLGEAATGDSAWDNLGAPTTDVTSGSENDETSGPSIKLLALVLVASAVVVVLGLLLVGRH